jgi:hypothetical protein
MSLRLGDKTLPDIQVFGRPLVRPTQEDVVRHDIIVAKSRHDRDLEVMLGIHMVLGAARSKHVCKFCDQQLILRNDLLLCSWYLLIIIVARRVAGPYDEVYAISQVLVDPFEGLVNQGEGGIAAGRLAAIHACRSSFAVASGICFGAGICLVEGVWVEIWSAVSVVAICGRLKGKA